MQREYYKDSISNFLNTSSNEILGELSRNNDFTLEQTQRDAWLEEIVILQNVLRNFDGSIYFEYSIPRMGKRIDVVVIIQSVIFVLEFKIGEKEYTSHAIDQVFDYALDLKNFHETSHDAYIAPVLIATRARASLSAIALTPQNDKLFLPVLCNAETLTDVIVGVLSFTEGGIIDSAHWESGRYSPTPTIVEAAMALYAGHAVENISRSDASATNLSETSTAVAEIIRSSKEHSQKSICFVTGVPGAGKTLVGLNVATQHIDKDTDLYSVFLSGNGPLVSILREALARDRVEREKNQGRKVKKGVALSEVKMFIQNVHNFRDACLVDMNNPPVEHVALFDEAQRAWDLAQTVNFMHRKRNILNFEQSEPEFLISCLDRHSDWATIVCLVGGGQEIHTGEAGISEWINALNRSFPDWHVYISPRLADTEYDATRVLEEIKNRARVVYKEELHLGVSMRSFRAEDVSLFVKQMLDIDPENARITLQKMASKYPIVITRDLSRAKKWLKENARGSERYGLLVSSQAERLKPDAIDVRCDIDPVHWFLDRKEDVRSSYYLEDAATEFQVQGLDLIGRVSFGTRIFASQGMCGSTSLFLEVVGRISTKQNERNI